ncbi:MAG: hypothetical protein QOC70_273 [Verrucomicrobiota bacterium]|jgi:hypothetical protein
MKSNIGSRTQSDLGCEGRGQGIMMFVLGLRMGFLNLLLLVMLFGCKKREMAAVSNSIPEMAMRALEYTPQITLYALNPTPDAGDVANPGVLHRFRIIGQTTLSSTEVRQRLVRTLQQDISRSEEGYDMCFFPRHAISARNEDTSYDFLICFECKRVEIFANKMRIATTGFVASEEPYDEIFRSAGLSIPKPPE